MNRRRFLVGGCAACSLLATGFAGGQPWQAPARFVRPDLASDEGGLWAMMDREERRARRSPFTLRDPELQAYVQGMVCKLAGQHCPDVRVYLVRTPYFNAMMAPNGMMQVWTGLMLRVENEAQLAAVLGHEIAHYLERHSIDQLRDAKTRSAFGTILGFLGDLGTLAQLGIVAGMLAYSRDHERAADRIGALLMHQAGYDVAEAAIVWRNLQQEIKAGPGEKFNPLLDTHPAMDERIGALTDLANKNPGGESHAASWMARIRPHLKDWLGDEVKRGQHEESIVVLTRMIERQPKHAEYPFARGEVYRLRGKEGDLDLALADYARAALIGGEPAETHRGMGFIHRSRKNAEAARASFQRYLDIAPKAPDAPMIRSYLQES